MSQMALLLLAAVAVATLICAVLLGHRKARRVEQRLGVVEELFACGIISRAERELARAMVRRQRPIGPERQHGVSNVLPE